MSKTVDELIGVYIEASNAVVWEAEKRGLCPMTLDMQRAGIAAVVRALRDEYTAPVKGCETVHTSMSRYDFNEILGDAGNEKVAGGSTREESGTDEKRGSKPLRKDGAEVSPRLPDPATDPCPRCGYPAQDQCDSPGCNIDPAPAVCEWREISVLDGIDHYSTKHGVKNRLHLYRKDDVCPVCLAPIKFTEART